MNKLSPTQYSPRLGLLDLLRFLAALAVVLFHFTIRTPELTWGIDPELVFPNLSKVTAYGAFGVDLFFIISGFVILMSAWGRTVPQFVASRASRLFPAYWFAVLFTGVFMALLSPQLIKFNPVIVLVNTTMLQSPLGIDMIDPVFWTLWVELCFYLLIGVVLLRGFTYKKTIALVALWPLAAILLDAMFAQSASFLQAPYAAHFAGGMCIYIIYRFGHSFSHWALLCLNIGICLGMSYPRINGLAEGGDFPISPRVGLPLILLCFALVAIATLTSARSSFTRVGPVLGRLTYPLYLIHSFFGIYLIFMLRQTLGTWETLLIALAAVLALAWLINRFVEQPFAGKLRRAILRPPRSAPAENWRASPTEKSNGADPLQ